MLLNDSRNEYHEISSVSFLMGSDVKYIHITAFCVTSLNLFVLFFSPQNNDQHRKYNIAGVTNGSSTADTPPAVGVEGTKEQRPFSRPFSPSLTHFSPASAGLVLDRFLRSSCHNEHDNQSAGSTPDAYEIR